MKPGQIINTHLCDICKKQIPTEDLNKHLESHYGKQMECRDGFNCIFCDVDKRMFTDDGVAHDWDHRNSGHAPKASVCCPSCLRAGSVEKVFRTQYEPGVLHYRCKCGHLYNSAGGGSAMPPPIIAAQGVGAEIRPEDCRPGPVISVPIGEDNGFQIRGPGIKHDAQKDDLWLHIFDNFPLSLGWLAAHMQAGDHEPGHVHHGWRTVPDGYNRYSAALLRHMLSEKDENFQTFADHASAATAALANAFIRLELLLRSDPERNK